MKVQLLMIPSILIFASGCASTVHRGVVAMKMNDTDAHVGFGSKEVSAGDHVQLFRNQCKKIGPGSDGPTTNCTRKALGHGTVTKVYSEDYSAVKFEGGVDFKEGDSVEKHPH